MTEQVWPTILWIVRHGESAGNVALRTAEAAGHSSIDLAFRDMDVPLSALGLRQAEALGQWFGEMPLQEQPTVILTSPSVRTRETARHLLDAARIDLAGLEYVVDERLREREFGILDRLTTAGIQQKYPEQAEFRAALGKFYHRPPGGESWCDVILRLRTIIDMVTRDYCKERVLLVAHQAVVLCFRYILEQMNEEQVLRISAEQELANCSVTTYAYDSAVGKRGGMALRGYNFVAPLLEAGTLITREPDAPVAPR